MRQQDARRIQALKVRQWLDQWDQVDFSPTNLRRRPQSHFYLFTMQAGDLLALTGITRRTASGGLPRSEDIGIQRRHDKERSLKIREFVENGYPWSSLNAQKRASGAYDDLKKPGWLPTAIIVNILLEEDERLSQGVSSSDLVTIEDSEGSEATVYLPEGFSGPTWTPTGRHPLEVIDGQHRLWAFENDSLEGHFELPVVAFHGLDISWQAYVFYNVNITPKRINQSLAFDMYPLLRTEDWLERTDEVLVYRETRAQELAEALWSNPSSPWHGRINMLGETGLGPMVSQAAWIRSLVSTFLRPRPSRTSEPAGLFAAALPGSAQPLGWSRAQQAGFLLLVGQRMRDAIKESQNPWADVLRKEASAALEDGADPAFAGAHSLLNTDQGIRALLFVANDLSFLNAQELELSELTVDETAEATDPAAVAGAIEALSNAKASDFVTELAARLARFDWRTSSAPGLSRDEQTVKAGFRGSGGYTELRKRVLEHLAEGDGDIADWARELGKVLGYDTQ